MKGKTKVEESTRLACTKLCSELEHRKIETRLINLSEMWDPWSLRRHETWPNAEDTKGQTSWSHSRKLVWSDDQETKVPECMSGTWEWGL
eukprot:14905_1